MFSYQSEQLLFSPHYIDQLFKCGECVCVCINIYINVCVCMTEGGEKAPVHLIDNRCKSLGKGVKGHCCHDNSV